MVHVLLYSPSAPNVTILTNIKLQKEKHGGLHVGGVHGLGRKWYPPVQIPLARN